MNTLVAAVVGLAVLGHVLVQAGVVMERTDVSRGVRVVAGAVALLTVVGALVLIASLV